MEKKKPKILIGVTSLIILAGALYLTYNSANSYFSQNKILKEIIVRLEKSSRVAEVLVTGVNYDEKTNQTLTTIKFLEYDVDDKPLEPKYFTFSGNIIQFQSLVIRFDDIHIRNKDKLRGKSAFLFWKVFLLDGKNTQEYIITKTNAIPQGYKLNKGDNPFEQKIWEEFWVYALNPKAGSISGIKNAQIEAPGAMFMPGQLYTISIEHDGGLRIDATRIPSILRGEKIPQ